MNHALQSFGYLKLVPDNHILFECQNSQKKEISIAHEERFDSVDVRKVNFRTLYKIRLWNLTLRELLLFKSIYTCSTMFEILKIIKDQPEPLLFFKSCMELNASNMTNYLTFDSRSLAHLLDDKHEEFFTDEYPLFYKNRFFKAAPMKTDIIHPSSYYYRWGLEDCLKSNQIKGSDLLTDYLVKYQNNFTSSYQLRVTITEMIEKGLTIKKLLDSSIFSYQFDFDQWPGNHICDSEEIRPYNGTIYDIAVSYKNVFPEDEFDFQDDTEVAKGVVVYKIGYCINLLPAMGQYCQIKPEDKEQFDLCNTGVDFLSLCNSTGEIEMFESPSLMDLISFKWN
jgi:hypothetical protein